MQDVDLDDDVLMGVAVEVTVLVPAETWHASNDDTTFF